MLMTVMFPNHLLALRLVSKGGLVPMQLRAFTLQDRMAVFAPITGKSSQSLLVLEPHARVSGEVLSGPGQNHPRNHRGSLVVENTEFQCLDNGTTG